VPATADAIVSVAEVSASSVAPRYHWKLVAPALVAVYCTCVPEHALDGPLIAALAGAAALSVSAIEFDTFDVPHEFTPYAVYVPASPAATAAIVNMLLVSASSVAPRYHWKLVAPALVAVYCTCVPGHAVDGPLMDGVAGAAALSVSAIELETLDVPHEFTPYAVYVPASPAATEAIVNVLLVSARSVAPRYHWKLVAPADVAVYCTCVPGHAVDGPLIEGALGAELTVSAIALDTLDVPQEFTP
jgi:hypothetical protein